MSFKPKHLTRLTRLQDIINRTVKELGVPETEEESAEMARRLQLEMDLLEDDTNESQRS